MLSDIRSQTRETLAAQFAAWNQPAYRLDQLLGWLYAKRAAAWEETRVRRGEAGLVH